MIPSADDPTNAAPAPPGVPPPQRHGGVASPEDPSFSYLLGRLALIEERVRQAVTVTNEDAAPSLADSLLGIHMSPEHIMKLFDQPRAHLLDESHNQELRAELEAWADHLEHTGVRLRLRELIRAFSLSSLDIEVLLIALAPEVDARFGQFYAYLNSDITCRRATIQLALLLCSASTASAADRARFTLHAPLVGGGLLTLQESEGPWPSQTLRVANRVVAHLLGDDSLDEGLIDTAYLACPQLLPMAVAHCQATQRLAAAVVRGEPLAYIQQDDPHTATALAVDAVTAAEESALVLHLGKDTSTEQVALLVSTALREARLRNCALIIGPADRTIPHLPSHALVPSWQDQPLPMIVTGACSWDPAWSQRLPLRITASPPTPAERTAQWQAALGELASQLPSAAAEMAASYRLSAKHIHQTVDAARRHAELEGTAVNLSHLRTSARVHNAAGLERLARRISPPRAGRNLYCRCYHDPSSGNSRCGHAIVTWLLARGGCVRRTAVGSASQLCSPVSLVPARPWQQKLSLPTLVSTSTSSTWPPSSTSTSAKLRKISTAYSPKRPMSMLSSCSTKPTPFSPSEHKSRTPMTAMPTSRLPTSFSVLRASTAWP